MNKIIIFKINTSVSLPFKQQSQNLVIYQLKITKLLFETTILFDYIKSLNIFLDKKCK